MLELWFTATVTMIPKAVGLSVVDSPRRIALQPILQKCITNVILI